MAGLLGWLLGGAENEAKIGRWPIWADDLALFSTPAKSQPSRPATHQPRPQPCRQLWCCCCSPSVQMGWRVEPQPIMPASGSDSATEHSAPICLPTAAAAGRFAPDRQPHLARPSPTVSTQNQRRSIKGGVDMHPHGNIPSAQTETNCLHPATPRPPRAATPPPATARPIN